MTALWLHTVINRPWQTLLFAIVVITIVAAGGQHLYFRGDYKVFFEPENQQLQDFEELQRIFNKNDNATIIVAPKSGTVFDQQGLTLLKALTDEAWQTPYSTRVDSITNYQHTTAIDDDLLVEDLVFEPQQLTTLDIANIRETALSEPSLVNRLVSARGHVALINITVQMSETDKTAKVFEVTEFVKTLSTRYQKQYPNVRFYHTGIIIMNHSFASEAQGDATTLVPIMLLAVVLMLLVLLRSLAATLATLVIIIASIAGTMGLAGWVGMFISTATANVPTIVLTLAVADCVHITGSLFYAMGQGQTQQQALRYSLKINVIPVFITSVTTAIGFLTMNFSNVPILRDLGNLTAVGVMLAFVCSMTLFPAMLSLVPLRTRNVPTNQGGLQLLAEWVIRHHRRILPLGTLIMMAISSFVVMNQVNDEAVKYFDQSTDFRQSADFSQQNLAGMSTIDFSLDTGEASGVNDPAFLQLVAEFSEWLSQRADVDHVSTITDTFKRLNKNMHGDDPSQYLLPGQQDLAAQYLLLYEMSLPYGLDLNNQLSVDKSSVRIVATVKDSGSNEYLAMEQQARAWLASRAPTIEVKIASPALMFAHIGDVNMKSMLKSLPLALLLISLLLIFALKSLRLGLISLLPNMLPAIIGFGLWGLISGEINLALSVVSGMSLGIIVDDTVHFLSKYQHARRSGKSAEEAVRFAFATVGRALWITTLVLTVGFSVLAMSAFRLNADMGQLTGIILVVALAVDFLFLPAFLLVFDKQALPSQEVQPDENKKHLVSP